jgi:cell division septation protein DedD
VYIVDGETLRPVTRVRGGAADFWYPFRWTGFRPRAATLDQPVQFATGSDSGLLHDSTAARGDSVNPPPAGPDTTARRAAGWTVSFAALLVPDKARDLAAQIHVGNETARVITAMREGSTIYRVVLGPYATRDEAERVGRESKNSYWVYEGNP